MTSPKSSWLFKIGIVAKCDNDRNQHNDILPEPLNHSLLDQILPRKND